MKILIKYFISATMIMVTVLSLAACKPTEGVYNISKLSVSMPGMRIELDIDEFGNSPIDGLDIFGSAFRNTYLEIKDDKFTFASNAENAEKISFAFKREGKKIILYNEDGTLLTDAEIFGDNLKIIASGKVISINAESALEGDVKIKITLVFERE